MNSHAGMQRAMAEIQTMLRGGPHRKNSTSSIASFAVSINSKETWKELCRDRDSTHNPPKEESDW